MTLGWAWAIFGGLALLAGLYLGRPGVYDHARRGARARTPEPRTPKSSKRNARFRRSSWAGVHDEGYIKELEQSLGKGGKERKLASRKHRPQTINYLRRIALGSRRRRRRRF